MQELLVPIHKKLGKNGKGLAQLSRDLLAKIKGKKQMCRQGNQGQAPWDEYRDAALQGWGQGSLGAAGVELGKVCKE